MTKHKNISKLIRRISRLPKIEKAVRMVQFIVKDATAWKTIPVNTQRSRWLKSAIMLNNHRTTESVTQRYPVPPITGSIQRDEYRCDSVQDIEFVLQDKQEGYGSRPAMHQETLERWLSAGILCPRETRLAEKLIKQIRHRKQLRPGVETRAAHPSDQL